MSVDTALYLRRTDGHRLTSAELAEALGVSEPNHRTWRDFPLLDGVHYVIRLEDEPGPMGDPDPLPGFGRDLPAQDYDVFGCLSVVGPLPDERWTQELLGAQCDRILATVTALGLPVEALFFVDDMYRYDRPATGDPHDLADLRIRYDLGELRITPDDEEGAPLTPEALRALLVTAGVSAQAADSAQFADGVAALTLPVAELDRLTAEIGTLRPPIQLLATHNGNVRNYWNAKEL